MNGLHTLMLLWTFDLHSVWTCRWFQANYENSIRVAVKIFGFSGNWKQYFSPSEAYISNFELVIKTGLSSWLAVMIVPEHGKDFSCTYYV